MFAKKIKNATIFNEGYDYMGTFAEMTLPKIVHSFEGWRGGGMLGPIPIDNGLEALDFEWTLGGWDSTVVRQMGTTQFDGVQLRAIGALQDDQSGAVTAAEAVFRGRHQELDFGNWKAGEDTTKKVKTSCAYYKLIENGEELLEIDLYAGIYRVGGVDRYAEIRAALGRA